MRISPFLSLMASALVAASPAMAEESNTSLHAEFLNNKGAKAGLVHLIEGAHGTLVHIKAEGLTPGAHGVHFHSIGDCSDHQHFKASAGHIASAESMAHGFFSAGAFHEGDLPNIYAGKDGVAEAEFFAGQLSLKGEGDTALTDADGSALVIHALPDDHLSQPIGGAGDRVACAVIQKQE